MIVFIVVVPKNSGLMEYREKGLNSLGLDSYKLFEVRGEDVPFWVNEFFKKGKNVIGLTGEDLFKEWSLENKNSKIKITKRITWEDPKAMFNKPALCLLGKKDVSFDSLPKNLRVCISSKYKLLAKKYLNLLEDKGYNFEKIYVSGCVEPSLSEGISDLIIDIVYTGSSMERYDLQIYEKLFESDFVVIGND